MNQYYEPYLAHWRWPGSKNGYHIFGKAQNPKKYANGSSTVGLMSEWNRRQNRANEWNTWGGQVKRDIKILGKTTEPGSNFQYVDSNGNNVGKPVKFDTVHTNAMNAYDDAKRRANIHKTKAQALVDYAGSQDLGRLYNFAPVKAIYNMQFKTAAKIYGAGGLGKYIKQSANNLVTNVKRKATNFMSILTGKYNTKYDIKDPWTLAEQRKKKRAATKANRIANKKGDRTTKYYQNQTQYAINSARRKGTQVATSRTGNSNYRQVTGDPNAARAMQTAQRQANPPKVSKYINRRYMPSAVY